MARGNKKDPSYVVLKITHRRPMSSFIEKIEAVGVFDARSDARAYRDQKADRSRSSNVRYTVLRVLPGPVNRK